MSHLIVKILFRRVAISALLAVVFTSLAQAAIIAWKAPADIQGDSDISTTGTYVDAIQAYGGSNVQGSGKAATRIKIGDTVFNPVHGSGMTYGDGTISYTGGSKAQFFNGNTTPVSRKQYNAFPIGSQASADYSTVVGNGAYYTWGAVGSMTFRGLTAGNIYQVQIWGFVQNGGKAKESFSDEVDNTATIDAAAHVPKSGSLTPGNPYGQYVIGYFQAKGSTATLDWTFGEGSFYGLFSALAVRDVSLDSGARESVTAAEAAAKAVADGTAPPAQPLKSPPGFNGVDVWKNIRYAKLGNHSLKLDIYVPQNASRPVPLVLYVHGGGWSALDKTEGFANGLLQHGFALACIDHRFTEEAIFPAQLYDCKAAIRWLRAHADQYGYAPEKIGAIGDSSGGHLVSMLGVTNNNPDFEGTEGTPGVSSSVQAVADYFGPSNMLTMDPTAADSAVPRLIGGQPAQNVEAAKKASPVFYADPNSCPFVIVQGDADKIVNPQQSVDLNAALQKAGVDSTLYMIPGAGHGVNNGKATDLCVALFNKYIR
jgi:acetyl esterase/lipase